MAAIPQLLRKAKVLGKSKEDLGVLAGCGLCKVPHTEEVKQNLPMPPTNLPDLQQGGAVTFVRNIIKLEKNQGQFCRTVLFELRIITLQTSGDKGKVARTELETANHKAEPSVEPRASHKLVPALIKQRLDNSKSYRITCQHHCLQRTEGECLREKNCLPVAGRGVQPKTWMCFAVPQSWSGQVF